MGMPRHEALLETRRCDIAVVSCVDGKEVSRYMTGPAISRGGCAKIASDQSRNQ